MNIYDFYITPEEYEIALRNGISNYTLERRIRLYGWSKERALTQKPQARTERDSWIKIAESNGISKKLFLARVNKNKWDCEKAATFPIKTTGERNRKYSDELYRVLDKNGISKALFYDRIRKGWNVEKASTHKIFTQEEKTKLLVESSRANPNYFRQMQESHWLLSEHRKLIL